MGSRCAGSFFTLPDEPAATSPAFSYIFSIFPKLEFFARVKRKTREARAISRQVSADSTAIRSMKIQDVLNRFHVTQIRRVNTRRRIEKLFFFFINRSPTRSGESRRHVVRFDREAGEKPFFPFLPYFYTPSRPLISKLFNQDISPSLSLSRDSRVLPCRRCRRCRRAPPSFSSSSSASVVLPATLALNMNTISRTISRDVPRSR